MLCCAASFVIATYVKVRLIPQYLRALPLEFFTKPLQMALLLDLSYEFIYIRFCLINQTERLYPKAVNYATCKYALEISAKTLAVCENYFWATLQRLYPNTFSSL
jgi:hypothetical protein